MKTQASFSLKDKSKKIKLSSAAIFVRCFKGFSFFIIICVKSFYHQQDYGDFEKIHFNP